MAGCFSERFQAVLPLYPLSRTRPEISNVVVLFGPSRGASLPIKSAVMA
jgi:hypothetical protein